MNEKDKQAEPVYAYRRRGLNEFCTCDERRYKELSAKPSLFEVAVFYTHPAPAVACSFPERDVTKPAEEQGLFRKFDVRRVDGSDAPGGKHHGCEYFVLDLDHDIHAPAAIREYAKACNETHPQLSAELSERFGPQPAVAQEPVGKGETLRESLFREFPLLEDHGLDEVEHHCEWNIQQERKRLHALLNKPPAVAVNQQLFSALQLFIDTVEEPPEANCSCHIAPPCGDCVNYSQLREAFEEGRAAISAAEAAKGICFNDLAEAKNLLNKAPVPLYGRRIAGLTP